MTASTSRTTVVLVNQNPMTTLANSNLRVAQEVADDRGCDCIRQLVGICLGGCIVCAPCTMTRMARDCCGLDPVRIQSCGMDCNIPGPELCGSPNGFTFCCEERGYEHNEYDRVQDNGTGFSRKALDRITCLTLGVWTGIFTGFAVTK